jgi:hypothetical protein
MNDKITKKILRLPIIARNTWGLTFESLNEVYLAAIEPSLLYGASVWSRKLNQKQVNKLKRLQRLYAIKMIRSYHTISCESATTIVGIKPIDLKLKEVINVNRIKSENSTEI